MVIGAPGSGKTTFCLYLAGYFCRRGKRVAWIDADPANRSSAHRQLFRWGSIAVQRNCLKRKPPLIMGFIGNVSPVGHLLDAVTCIQKIYNKALELTPDLVLINTCGLVNGAAARELAYHQIDMLAPRYVIAIQQKERGRTPCISPRSPLGIIDPPSPGIARCQGIDR